MIRERRIITRLTAVCLTASALFAAGCDGSDFNFNIVVPVGLGGTPGILNPFGIVQAFVNAWLSTILPSGSTSTTTTGTSTTAGLPTPSSNLGAIGAVATQNGT